jgi:hypothetical protein
MPELIDIQEQVPTTITSRLLAGEPVYYYSAGSGGCLPGMGPKEWFALTNRRVLMTRSESGMLGMRKMTGTIDIPLEHVSSVGSVVVKGCLGTSGAILVQSTGAAENRAIVRNRQDADLGTSYVQQTLHEFRQNQQGGRPV